MSPELDDHLPPPAPPSRRKGRREAAPAPPAAPPRAWGPGPTGSCSRRLDSSPASRRPMSTSTGFRSRPALADPHAGVDGRRPRRDARPSGQRRRPAVARGRSRRPAQARGPRGRGREGARQLRAPRPARQHGVRPRELAEGRRRLRERAQGAGRRRERDDGPRRRLPQPRERHKALELFGKALAKEPDHWPAAFNEAIVYGIDQGEKAKAIEILNKIKKEHPEVKSIDGLLAALDQKGA